MGEIIMIEDIFKIEHVVNCVRNRKDNISSEEHFEISKTRRCAYFF
jgi:hypothetical protein